MTRNEMYRKVLIYEKMISRIENESKLFNYALIYYSVCLIAYSLFAVIFPMAIDQYWFPFCNIMISVVMLVFSVINNHTNFQERIHKISKSKSELNKLLAQNGVHISEEAEVKYYSIVDNTERETQEDINRVDQVETSFYQLMRPIIYIVMVIMPFVIFEWCVDWSKL